MVSERENTKICTVLLEEIAHSVGTVPVIGAALLVFSQGHIIKTVFRTNLQTIQPLNMKKQYNIPAPNQMSYPTFHSEKCANECCTCAKEYPWTSGSGL